jgi:GNAT superfamily N-acetyltransferase
MKTKDSIKSELRDTRDDAFDYDGETASISAVPTGETSVKIGHFVVKREKRRNVYGSVVFESLLEILRDEGYRSVLVEIQCVEDGGTEDPVVKFLENYGFRYIGDFEHHNWDICVRAMGHI